MMDAHQSEGEKYTHNEICINVAYNSKADARFVDRLQMTDYSNFWDYLPLLITACTLHMKHSLNSSKLLLRNYSNKH